MSMQDNKPSKRPGQTEEEFRQFHAKPRQPQAGQIREEDVLPHKPEAAHIRQRDAKPQPEAGQIHRKEIHEFRPAEAKQDERIRQSDVQPKPEAAHIRRPKVQPQPEAGQIRKQEIHRFKPADAAPQDKQQIHQRGAEPRQQQNNKLNDPADQVVLSADEVERIINYVEQEYGAEVSSEVKKVVREEISSAVPELTRVLLPLFTANEEGNDAPSSEEIQQECVKAFLHIMVPHMQRIVRSVQ
ncbi:hypothetical protein [Anaplasma bovis]|uniref:hypothetical protein n=1 Tax=Anaplasma bovis TaxID=186733 RepID=UPI002FF3020F